MRKSSFPFSYKVGIFDEYEETYLFLIFCSNSSLIFLNVGIFDLFKYSEIVGKNTSLLQIFDQVKGDKK